MSQLFVGRLPRGTRARDLEDIFYKYGKMTRCDVKQGELDRNFLPDKMAAVLIDHLCLSFPVVCRHQDG